MTTEFWHEIQYKEKCVKTEMENILFQQFLFFLLPILAQWQSPRNTG